MSNVQVIFNENKYLIVLGDQGVELSRAEAEQLFVDLGYALQDQDIRKKEKDQYELQLG